MKGKRILVTGGAGFVGSATVKLLVAEGASDILVLDNFSRGRMENLQPEMTAGPVRVIEGDIRDRDLVMDLMDGVDLLFHQAALRITQCAREPREAFEVMAAGAFNVFEAAVDRKVKKVVAASSASIYGQADQFPITEKHAPYNDVTLYGACKSFNEGLLRSFHDMQGLHYICLRYFNVYGPRMDIHGKYTEVLIRWMQRIKDGKSPIIFGDGNQTMDFVYIDDVARSNLLAAQSEAGNCAINVASGTETSLTQLALELARIMGSDLRPEYRAIRTVNGVFRRVADIHNAKSLIGFEARTSLTDGLRQLVQWWSKEPTNHS